MAQPEPAIVGKWADDMIELKNVAAHASLLPNGKILYWGRRSNPKSFFPSSMKEHTTEPWILDPSTGKNVPTKGDMVNQDHSTLWCQPQPWSPDNRRSNIGDGYVNLFCSGHTHQQDGNLIVVGGHIEDGRGSDQTCIYDWQQDKWFPKPPMTSGRWYPSALPLPTGDTLAISGNNDHTPQIFRQKVSDDNPDKWIEVHRDNAPSNFPRMHLDSTGKIFVAGPSPQSEFLDLSIRSTDDELGVGAWSTRAGLDRNLGDSQYAASVMYDTDKVMYIGGGNDPNNQVPTNQVEFIDLTVKGSTWTTSPDTDMQYRRRHHCATILPNGTVLVTGGTQGAGFNNVTYRNPVHEAELYDPSKKKWTTMAPEREDRCYHHTALLLPNAQVLSAGGGEWGPFDGPFPNANKDSITNAQLFSPPYLFSSPQPTVSGVPGEIRYNTPFDVTVGPNDSIKRASLVSIGSVTHCVNMNQFFTFLKTEKKPNSQKISVTGPPNHNLTPAGYYMLFLLNQEDVPSVAPIVRLLPEPQRATYGTTSPSPVPAPGNEPMDTEPTPGTTVPSMTEGGSTSAPSPYGTTVKDLPPSIPDKNRALIADHTGPDAVVVGITPICPYGLSPCWAGAFHGLQGIDDIKAVDPKPVGDDCVAIVYLHQEIVPDVDKWRRQLANTARGSYAIRGLEITLSGVVSEKQTGSEVQLTMAGTSDRPEVILAPYKQCNNVRMTFVSKSPKPITPDEAGAYEQLSTALGGKAAGSNVQVTGVVQKDANGYSLEVRQFKVV